MVRAPHDDGMTATTEGSAPAAARPAPAAARDDASVPDALAAYLDQNGFRAADYDAPTFTVQFLGRDWTLRNHPDRARAIPLHDLHHVATGYATNLVGEGEIGAWELGAGCDAWIVYALNAAALTVGLFLAPRRMLAAYRAGRRGRTLYRLGLRSGDAARWSVGELRDALGVPRSGLA